MIKRLWCGLAWLGLVVSAALHGSSSQLHCMAHNRKPVFGDANALIPVN